MIDQIDQKSHVEACCIKYKQLVKGQKDDGRRETMTWQMINKQKNFKMLFVCLYVCLVASVTQNVTQQPLLAL